MLATPPHRDEPGQVHRSEWGGSARRGADLIDPTVEAHAPARDEYVRGARRDVVEVGSQRGHEPPHSRLPELGHERLDIGGYRRRLDEDVLAKRSDGRMRRDEAPPDRHPCARWYLTVVDPAARWRIQPGGHAG